jgi:O-antigen ligase
MASTRTVLTPFWLCQWSFVLAVGWLLPNHYRPWLTFHTDAWVALTLLVVSIVVIVQMRGTVAVHGISVLVALLVCVPFVQHVIGILPLAGNAWVSSAYLFGLFMALLIGAQWEKNSPGQLSDGLFLAIGIASLLSVGLQLYQWLQLDGLELWSMGGGEVRPHANFGQPNQLATFLLWGLLAAAWGLVRKRISIWTALLMAGFILFGIAMTGSRTAWIGVALLVGFSWCWRKLWGNSRVPWVVTGMGIYFIANVVVTGWFRHNYQGAMEIDDVFRMSTEIRPLAWRMFIDAIGQHPWLGYGWNQVVLAQVAVAVDHPHVPGVFSYAHNILLDLILWCGVPLGLFVFFFVIWWLWKQLRSVRHAEHAVLLLFLLVIFNHALLELPLYFAYFLLPVGMVMGVLNARLGEQPALSMGRGFFAILLAAGMTLMTLIIRDYSRIEPSYQILRMEWSRIEITMPVGPPDVLLLTQWHDYIKYARFEPRAGLSVEDLDWMRNVAALFPGTIFFHKLATALALNHKPEEASLWLQRMCKIVPDSDCLSAKDAWGRQALKNPEIAAIPWPVKVDSSKDSVNQ